MQEEPTKHCTGCDQTKPITAFGSDRSKPSGVTSRCRACINARRGEFVRNGPEPTRPDYVVEDLGYATPCWRWLKALNRTGYGIKVEHGRWHLAHRWSYEKHGPIPDDLPLDHLCRNRACVNPDHLEPVTLRENALRGKFGRLTEEDVADMRARSDEGCCALAREYGVSDTHVSEILRGKRWKGVPPRPKAQSGQSGASHGKHPGTTVPRPPGQVR